MQKNKKFFDFIQVLKNSYLQKSVYQTTFFVFSKGFENRR